MNLKTLSLAITCLLLIISCKDKEPEGGYDPVSNTDTEYSLSEEGIEEVDVDKEKINNVNESEPENTSPADPDNNKREGSSTPGSGSAEISGQYIKVGEEADSNCGCYCIDLTASSNPELCLVPDEMYISTRLEKNNDKTINVFLVGPSGKNTKGSEIPWDKFDKNVPIATVSPSSNGEVDIDWLGFTIDGDLAMDYAIYGKKTLEGKFKKK